MESAGDAEEAQLSRRDWWAALDGQARDQSRLSEGDRATQARGGAGTAPRCTRERERALEEADVRAAVRSKAAAASWLGEGAEEGAAAAAEAVGEPAVGGAADRPEPALPMTLERPSAMESSSAASAVS